MLNDEGFKVKKRIKVCKFCKKEFVVNSNRQMYCSRSCKDKAYWRRRHPIWIKYCEFCGEIFEPNHNNTRCCSKECTEKLHIEKSRHNSYLYRKKHPELKYRITGSKGTSTSYKVKKDENGKPDWDKERESVKKLKKKLGL